MHYVSYSLLKNIPCRYWHLRAKVFLNHRCDSWASLWISDFSWFSTVRAFNFLSRSKTFSEFLVFSLLCNTEIISCGFQISIHELQSGLTGQEPLIKIKRSKWIVWAESIKNCVRKDLRIGRILYYFIKWANQNIICNYNCCYIKGIHI